MVKNLSGCWRQCRTSNLHTCPRLLGIEATGSTRLPGNQNFQEEELSIGSSLFIQHRYPVFETLLTLGGCPIDQDSSPLVHQLPLVSSNQTANIVPPPSFPWKRTSSRLGPGGWPARTLPLQNLPREQRDGYKPPPISWPQVEYLGPLKTKHTYQKTKGVEHLQPSTPGTSTIKKKDTTGDSSAGARDTTHRQQHTGLSALGSKTSNRQ